MKNKVITISRESGSGGHTIGKKVGERLGISCYDNELIQKIAAESGFDEKYIKDSGEYSPGGLIASAFSHNLFGPSNVDYLWDIQCRTISELALKGPCIIVGRCADYVLRDKADCLRVFIHADLGFRMERISKEYGEDSLLSEEQLRDMDKRRGLYYQFYTDMKWGDVANYDITLNSGNLGIDECVNIIENVYRKRK